MGYTGLKWVKLGDNGFERVSLGLSRLEWVILGYTGLKWIKMGLNRFQRV